MSHLLLAVDGGGTKTRAVVTDAGGKTLGNGLGPSSNKNRVGFDQSLRAITTAIEGALKSAGLEDASFSAACLGLAGVDTPADAAEVSAWVSKQGIAPRFKVVNDSELILAGGTPEGWGVAIESGTGSVCLGRAPDGRSLRIGGWGSLLGDEGSGYAIAVCALRLAAQAADGRSDARSLLDAVLRHWALPDTDTLIRHAYAPQMTHSEIAGLAATVSNLASQGEPHASRILEEAAAALALHVDTVVKRLDLKRPHVALAGGTLKGPLRKGVEAAIRSDISAVTYVEDPSVGAVTIARRLLEGGP